MIGYESRIYFGSQTNRNKIDITGDWELESIHESRGVESIPAVAGGRSIFYTYLTLNFFAKK
jgi:hypothetical protein